MPVPLEKKQAFGPKLFAEQVAIPFVLGVLAFLGVTGGRILAPRNIAWLGNGDPATYFLSWDFFRHTPWGSPLGLNPRYGAELGSAIAYADNLPLFALPFKVVSRWLPEPFQYFGIWILCCFVLQAWFGWLLTGLVTRERLSRACGTALFVLAPPFLWRLQGHYQMEGQWLVLAALYLCFGPRTLGRGAAWPLLAFTASLVHSYLTAMVLGLWLADWLRRLIFEAHTRATLVQFLAVPCVVVLAFWQAGLFTVGSGAVSTGFGYYRMNLASLIDPSGWSYVLPDLREAPGDYEGFNYLGLGGILLLVAALPALKGVLPVLRAKRQYWPLLVLLVCLTLFAVSNNIGLADGELSIPLPQSVIDRADLLRSSGRLFWPVFYVLFWVSLRAICRLYPPRVVTAILCITVTAQVVDISAGLRPIRRDLLVAGSTWDSPLKSPFWTQVPARYCEIRLASPKNQAPHYAVFAYFAALHGMSTDAAYLARIDDEKLKRAKREASHAVHQGVYSARTLYVLERWQEAAARRSVHDTDLLEWVDGFLVLAPNWHCSSAHLAGRATAADCSTNDK
jgi:hypothetical protein